MSLQLGDQHINLHYIAFNTFIWCQARLCAVMVLDHLIIENIIAYTLQVHVTWAIQ